MAEAANTPTLLERFSNQALGNLPATVEERSDVGVVERGDRGKGRTPEEVLGDRQDRTDVVETRGADTDQPILKKKYRVKVNGSESELSLKEIAERGLMEALISSAEQLPHLSRKHNELLEKIADKDLSKPKAEEAAPAPVRVTQDQITRAFMPVLQERVSMGYVEPDMAEAYPLALTGAMYNEARLTDTEQAIIELRKENAAMKAWILAEIQKRKTNEFVSEFDKAIDTVAAKADDEENPEKVFLGLKDQAKRASFVEWLRKEVDPKSDAISPALIERFWMAFIGPDLLKFAKEAAVKSNARTDKRRAAGDGAGARPGPVESPKPESLLDRMTDYRLGNQDA